MKEELIKTFIPGVRVYISVGDSQHTWIGSNKHFHNEIELVKVMQGKMRFDVNDTVFTGVAGDIVFIAPRIPHETTSIEDATQILLVQLNPNQQYDSYLFKLMRQSEKEYYLFNSANSIYQELNYILDKLLEESRTQDKGYELYLKSWLYALLGFFSRNRFFSIVNNELEDNLIQKINPVIEYVENNYSHNISLESASELLNLHPIYFCRIFKEATGKTFINYLNFVRISKAEDLLIFTNKSITEIAMETGFTSVQYFNRIFKEAKGRTPTEFRKIRFSL